MPDPQRRLTETTVNGGPVWTVEEFSRDCPCPDCPREGHWQLIGRFRNKKAAIRAVEFKG